MPFHKDAQPDDIHVAHSREYANATSRLAASVSVSDVGRVARQLDDGSFWILRSAFPVVWEGVGSSGSVPLGRSVVAGNGLSGGGALTADVSLNVVPNQDGSIVVISDSVGVGVLASDTQHGNRGGGGLHAIATTTAAGFLSASDKNKLDGVSSGATNTPLSSSVPIVLDADTASIGASSSAARADHKHTVSVGAPVPIGLLSSAGSSVSLSRSDHVHDVPFSVLHNVLAGASSAISINGQRLSSVADPVHAQDAVPFGFLQSYVLNKDPKESCIAATTGDITLSGAQTIDGVAVSSGRVLVKNQTNPEENGIYIVTSGAWVRSSDANSSLNVTTGLTTFIEQGTVNASTIWSLTTAGTVTVGTTPLTFTQTGGLNTYVAGSGLGLSGNVFSVGAPSDGSIIIHADSIQVGVLATDAQHGNRGGGGLHSLATGSVAGFMSSSDKAKLDGLPTSAPPVSRTVTAGDGLLGGGDLSADIELRVGAHADGSIVVNSGNIQVGVLASDTQHGNRGGGGLHSLATGSVAGFMSATDKSKLDGLPSSVPDSSRNIIAGAGLAGGGNLTADRTIDIVALNDSIHITNDGISVGVLQTDAQHGTLGGGSTHAIATTTTAGFLSASDKTKLDSIAAGADGGIYRQSIFKEVSANVATSSTTFVTLLDQTINMLSDGYLVLCFTGSFVSSASAALLSFQLLVDGVPLRGTATRTVSTNTPMNCSIVYKTGLLALGSHTVTVQWRTSSGTAQIRPASQPNEHASLHIQECTV